MLVLGAPLLAVLALIVRVDAGGPAFFRQTRLGLGGKPFSIFKFRTMRVMEDGDTIVQVTKGDCRVTRSGKWLRRTSLDELPQLLNVIAGDMSLVGPRPHARAHDKHYATVIANYDLRQDVKPGITGWPSAWTMSACAKTARNLALVAPLEMAWPLDAKISLGGCGLRRAAKQSSTMIAVICARLTRAVLMSPTTTSA